MKIVILDGQTVNLGDLSWEPFEKLGKVTFYPRTKKSEVFERSKDAEIVMTNKIIFDEDLISRLPKLKYIGVFATGHNVVDLKAASKRNIVVTNVPDYCSQSVVQMTFAHIFEHVHRIGYYTKVIQEENKWVNSPDFIFIDHPLRDLQNKVLGIVGCGNIGLKVATIANTFGMEVIAYKRNPFPSEIINFTDLETVFKRSDVLTLHCPLTDETKEIINKDNLAKMKNTAYLINVSRGKLVNEKDLSEALRNGVIAGAGVDVLSTEPPKSDNPLLKAPNCFITPHLGFATLESRRRLIDIAAGNINAFLKGEFLNRV